MTWPRGQGIVQSLVSDGSREYVSGAGADGAARMSCAALLAQQGPRTKSGGHHVTTEYVVRAQFGGPFDAFPAFRRRRSEIEYPSHPGEDVSQEEAAEAVARATAIHHATGQLLPNLPHFRPTPK